MILYSIHGQAPFFAITKFDDSFNVESTYAISERICECPAYPRKHHCKHIDILDKFTERGYLNTNWFYCKETNSWHKPSEATAEDEFAEDAQVRGEQGAFVEVEAAGPTVETHSEPSIDPTIEPSPEPSAEPSPSAPAPEPAKPTEFIRRRI